MKYKKLKRLINKIGFDVRRYPNYLLRNRMQMIKKNSINVVLDIGANVGQYAQEMRYLGYEGKIISFEPLTNAYQILEEEQQNDSKWTSYKMALGDKNEKAQINISNTSASSSLLEMLPSHLDAAPMTKFVETELIDVRTLDSLFLDLMNSNDNIYLKMDVQGFEKNVLDGAKESLQHIIGIQLELSLIPLYADELTYIDMIKYVENLGFDLFSLEPGFANTKTGQLLQIEGIFFRRKN